MRVGLRLLAWWNSREDALSRVRFAVVACECGGFQEKREKRWFGSCLQRQWPPMRAYAFAVLSRRKAAYSDSEIVPPASSITALAASASEAMKVRKFGNSLGVIL